MIQSTHSYATLAVSRAAYDEIRSKLVAARYDHVVHKAMDGSERVVMDGLGLVIDTAAHGDIAIPIGPSGWVARVPYPMSEEDFELLIETLKLWRRKLVTSSSEGLTSGAAEPKVTAENESAS